jgi:hypothetical protein
LEYSINGKINQETKIFEEWKKINQTKAMELKPKDGPNLSLHWAILVMGAKTWWRDNYLFIKTIIYSGGKPKLNFILSKSQHQIKQEKRYLIDIIKKKVGILI